MGNFNVLVCDDDKAIVDALEIYLKQENYNVLKAYTGVRLSLWLIFNQAAKKPANT